MCMMLGALLIPVHYELSNFFFSIYLFIFFFLRKKRNLRSSYTLRLVHSQTKLGEGELVMCTLIGSNI